MKIFRQAVFAVALMLACAPSWAGQATVTMGLTSDQDFVELQTASKAINANETALFGTLPPKASPSVGVVAGGGTLPDNYVTSKQNMQAVSPMVAYDTLTSPQLVFPGFYVNGAAGEVTPPSTISYHAAIEYPKGTCTQVPINGQYGVVQAPQGGMLFTDAAGWSLPVPIPPKAMFWVHAWATSPTAVYLKGAGAAPADSGATLDYGTTGSPIADNTIPTNGQTTGPCPSSTNSNGASQGTRTAAGSGYYFAPIAVLQRTTVQSVAVVGDSISNGYLESIQSDQVDHGVICRAVGLWGPCLNLGVSQDTLGSFLNPAVSVNRRAMLAFASQVVNEDGTNDAFTNGTPATTMWSNVLALKALMPSNILGFRTTTLTPNSTSSDSFATVANQTANANCTAIVLPYNRQVRAGSAAAGMAPPIDIHTAFASGFESCKWALSPYGTPATLTSEGVHPFTVGYDRPAEMGLLAPARF